MGLLVLFSLSHMSLVPDNKSLLMREESNETVKSYEKSQILQPFPYLYSQNKKNPNQAKSEQKMDYTNSVNFSFPEENFIHSLRNGM